ncbi:hypothetical protein EMIHUDRAFT_205935 [Emiliania huxleyi CCMP1516]|uniref:Poly(A) RNA polymerase mitochondrial-like central palm domain-containing protein n=2 Tax=Emiliania huxleyi TaxID=2903 RepID=A0A0D3JQK6_EMIH1|nr:hypothetical protein EMIHUDRAFT_205935 [Emiliania huxleyi CCMP1516]EOD25791.1 hypothetical protein EMIHUDRAFT_205935 [Emiliania huxleyi CCMP1516]|eukprot:XP_005778220.1 hypothetical protein EMIHUDRAFT_205935 [Emiliania huxleyi CCMP1516]
MLATPTDENRSKLLAAISRIDAAIRIAVPWTKVEVRLFGSTSNGLFLPGVSDIDLTVLQPYITSAVEVLQRIEDAVLQEGIAARGTVELIASARVPILKFTEQESRTAVDISVNGPQAVAGIVSAREMLTRFPELRPLLLVLNESLQRRRAFSAAATSVSSRRLGPPPVPTTPSHGGGEERRQGHAVEQPVTSQASGPCALDEGAVEAHEPDLGSRLKGVLSELAANHAIRSSSMPAASLFAALAAELERSFTLSSVLRGCPESPHSLTASDKQKQEPQRHM